MVTPSLPSLVAMESLTADCRHQLPTTSAQLQRQIGQQLVGVLDMILFARKMRIAVPASETSKLAAQVGSDTQMAVPVSTEPLQKPSTGGPFPRRYSKAQEEVEIEVDSFDTDHILQRFTNSMALNQYSRLRGPAASTSEWSSTVANAQSLAPPDNVLTKCLSTSDISKMAPSAGASAGSATPLEPSQGLISRYLGRRGSTGNVLARVSPDALKPAEESSSNSQNSQDSALVPSPAFLSRRRASFDVTDSSSFSDSGSSGSAGPSKGFGLLSRTRQFGAWLTKATEGEKVEVSRPDLNVVAPTSF